MTFKIWEWFQLSLQSLLGKAIKKLTEQDGQAGLSWEDIRTTAELMRHAEFEFGTGAERREWVIDQIKRLRQIFLPHLIELVFYMALNLANKEGWISLRGSGNSEDASE